MIRKIVWAGLLFSSCLLVSCKDEKRSGSKIETAPVRFTKEADVVLRRPSGDTLVQLAVELAENDYERETGLMYRDSMASHRGMLFIFEDEKIRGFYMKNTTMPLDLIFLNSDERIVHIHPEAAPESLETIPSEVPAQYVLEVNGGMAQAWNLKEGDHLILNREE